MRQGHGMARKHRSSSGSPPSAPLHPRWQPSFLQTRAPSRCCCPIMAFCMRAGIISSSWSQLVMGRMGFSQPFMRKKGQPFVIPPPPSGSVVWDRARGAPGAPQASPSFCDHFSSSSGSGHSGRPRRGHASRRRTCTRRPREAGGCRALLRPLVMWTVRVGHEWGRMRVVCHIFWCEVPNGLRLVCGGCHRRHQ